MFAVKLANFLMFTASEENTVKCLGGSLDIFGNDRTSSLVFGGLRGSSVSFGNLLKESGIVVKWPKTPLYTKQNIIGLFGTVFASFWKQFTVSKNFH